MKKKSDQYVPKLCLLRKITYVEFSEFVRDKRLPTYKVDAYYSAAGTHMNCCTYGNCPVYPHMWPSKIAHIRLDVGNFDKKSTKMVSNKNHNAVCKHTYSMACFKFKIAYIIELQPKQQP